MKALKYLGRAAIVLLTFVLITAAGLYGAMWIMVNGPSENAGKLFILSVRETSAAGFLADWFMSKEEIDALYNSPQTSDDIEIDTSLIHISKGDKDSDTPGTSGNPSTPGKTADPAPSTTDFPGNVNDIEVVDVNGRMFNGKMLIVKDPTRVFVGTPDNYGADCYGLTVMNMVLKYDAVAGINAGGFIDPNGTGTGGLPDGIVISGGKLLWGNLYSSYNLAGIDGNGMLYVGTMTAQRALALGIKEAASYGPALIINGVPCNSNYQLGGGLNPRTAIGQRSDGAILLLVVNGRTADSLGATYDDLVEVMMSFGAVNATNLDGGSSSLMIYNGEYITKSSYILGERVVATSFLVRKKASNE